MGNQCYGHGQSVHEESKLDVKVEGPVDYVAEGTVPAKNCSPELLELRTLLDDTHKAQEMMSYLKNRSKEHAEVLQCCLDILYFRKGKSENTPARRRQAQNIHTKYSRDLSVCFAGDDNARDLVMKEVSELLDTDHPPDVDTFNELFRICLVWLGENVYQSFKES